jgi:fibronectin-binding autotransporter adhesin
MAVLATAAAATAVIGSSQNAMAIDYLWSGPLSGTQAWDVGANWNPVGVPNADADFADLAVGLTGNLGVSLPGAGVTVNKLRLGGTGSAVTTDIGAANVNNGILTLSNQGTASTIESAGVAGSVNLISAPIQLKGISLNASDAKTFEVLATSTNNLSFSGGIQTLFGNTGQVRTLTNNMPLAQTLTISGPIQVNGTGSTNTGTLVIGGSGNTTLNGDIVNGALNGGTLQLGTTSSSVVVPIPTITVRGNNTYSSTTILNRANYIIDTDSPWGTGEVRGGNPSGAFGFNLTSTADRTFSNIFRIVQNLTFKGDFSQTYSGYWYQSNGRVLTSFLPAGEKVTIGGGPDSGLAAAFNTDTTRTLTFDGPGEFAILANVYNHRKSSFPGTADDADPVDDAAATGSIVKNGTGLITFSGTASTYKGATSANGGLMQFATPAALGATSHVTAAAGGSVGLLTTSFDPALITKIQASATPSTGSLALASGDAATPIDYTGAGNMSHANTVGMSVGAVAAGVSYTGTITPDPTRGYRLGGGGTLTLPNANQLTGARDVTVVNGGNVVLANANDYSGTTTIKGNYIVSTAQASAADNNNLVTPGVLQTSTLSFSNPNALGTSSDAAANLKLAGGTLKYTGAGDTSTRLFTITPGGATLDASGTGALNLSNPGAVTISDLTGSYTGNTTTSGNTINLVNDISELQVGMTVSGGNLPDGTTITGFNPVIVNVSSIPTGAIDYRIRTSANATQAITGASLTFGNQLRTLNLTGTNTGDNTIAATIGNSPTGALGVSKSGAGKWILAGATTYAGPTSVSAGTLVLGQSQTTTSAVTVTGGTLELAAGGGTRVLKTPTYTVSGTGKIDIKDGKLISGNALGTEAGGTYSGVLGDIQRAYVGGAWTGPGLTSSLAAGTTSIGAISASQKFGIGATDTAVFAGQTVTGAQTLAMYTYGGDANLDGFVSGDDYSAIDFNIATPGADSWSNGDFNYDGIISGDDYSVIDFNIVAQGAAFPTGASAGLSGVTAVPEPASMSVLALGAAALLGRRRRRAN